MSTMKSKVFLCLFILGFSICNAQNNLDILQEITDPLFEFNLLNDPPNSFRQGSFNVRLDSIVGEGYNQNTTSFNRSSKNSYEYTAQGLIESIIHYKKGVVNTIYWAPEYAIHYTYDNNNQVIERLWSSDWNQMTQSWDTQNRIVVKYSNGNKTLQTHQFYSTTIQAWANENQTEFYYDTNNLLTGLRYFEWDAFSWVLTFKTDYVYNSFGKPITKTDSTLTNGMWELQMDAQYSYNTANLINELISSNISGPLRKHDFAYNQNNKIATIVASSFLASNWVPSYKSEHAYDVAGNQVEREMYLYNSTTQLWEFKDVKVSSFYTSYLLVDVLHPGNDEFVYNPYPSIQFGWSNNATDQDSTFAYNSISNVIEPRGISTYYYSDLLSNTETPQTATSSLTVYPNPAHDVLQFSLSDHKEPSTVLLYAMNGQLVIQKQLQEGSLRLPELPAGVYTYRLKQADKVYTGKVVLE